MLRFLRADKYNVIAASKRIIIHFDVKEELFGRNSKLGRDITYNDLSDEEKNIFDSGKNRFLRHTDSAGRTIFFTRPGKINYNIPTSELRVGWVLVNGKDSPLTTNKNNCQILGFVHLAYVLDGYPKGINFELFRCGAKMLLGTPMRFVSMYILEENAGVGWKNVIDFFTYVMGNVMRVRTRTISGKFQLVFSLSLSLSLSCSLHVRVYMCLAGMCSIASVACSGFVFAEQNQNSRSASAAAASPTAVLSTRREARSHV